MSISRVYLCLIFLTFLTARPVLCSRSLKFTEKKLEREHIHSSVVSGPTKVDSSASMTKIDDESATNSAIAGFYKYKYPFQGWPFHKYAPFPMVTPANPSAPTTPSEAEEEETEKVPSPPSKRNK